MAVFEQVDFYGAFDWLKEIGAFDIVFPFLLIFAVTFAILDKISLFGDQTNKKAKRINALVSLIMAFFLVSQTSLVEIIQGFLPRISMGILVLLMLLLVVGVFKRNAEWTQGLLLIGVILSVGLVLWAIGASAGWEVPLIDEITEQDIAVLLMIGVFVLVIWLIAREPPDQPRSNREGLLDWLGLSGGDSKRK